MSDNFTNKISDQIFDYFEEQFENSVGTKETHEIMAELLQLQINIKGTVEYFQVEAWEK